MNHSLSRRTLAQGAAWSVPVVAAAAAVPAFAASHETRAYFCHLFFGKGTATNTRMTIGLKVSSPDGQLKQGEKVQWIVTGAEKPGISISASTKFTTAVSSTAPYVITMTVLEDMPVSDFNAGCLNRLLWDGSAAANSVSVSPGQTITLQGISSQNSQDKLSLIMPRRDTTEKLGYLPVEFTTATNGCFPEIQWTAGIGATRNEDKMTKYPDGSTAVPTGNAGNDQRITVAKGTCA